MIWRGPRPSSKYVGLSPIVGEAATSFSERRGYLNTLVYILVEWTCLLVYFWFVLTWSTFFDGEIGHIVVTFLSRGRWQLWW